MAVNKRFCETHGDRLAIGVCVITGKAICEECSTRYEGVNYSLEGLRIVQERRAAARRRASSASGRTVAACICLTPVLLVLLALAYQMLADMILIFMNR